MTRTTYLLAAFALVAACGKKPEAPKVEAPVVVPTPPPAPEPTATVEFGRALGADTRVLAALETFGPKDTIYAAVSSANVPAGDKIIATWTHESGAVVKVDTVASAAQTEFHISKKSGWPLGKYTATFTTSAGKSLGSKAFTVAKK